MIANVLIAVVDDDDSAREAIIALVRSLGFLAVGFASAADFLAAQNLYQIGCLILDMRMPEISGLDLHRRLVASGVVLPTILVTAYPGEMIRSRALSSGDLHCLPKPLEAESLLAYLGEALSRTSEEPDEGAP